MNERQSRTGPKDIFMDLIDPRDWKAMSELVGKILLVNFYWARNMVTHPIRTFKEVSYLGEFKHGFDPNTHLPNPPKAT